MLFPKKLQDKIDLRKATMSLRELPSTTSQHLVDFSSNDYLGYANSEQIYKKTSQILKERHIHSNGASGSRLLSGNHSLYSEAETIISDAQNAEDCLIYNSGYDANIGFFSAVPQRGDIVLYDEFIHASIRDGIQLSYAKAFKFSHNSMEDLEQKIMRFSNNNDATIYVVTESVFSMDGDSPNLPHMISICANHKALIVIDEAHALGVFRFGLVQELGLEAEVFARIVTFGKALGCHGAAILGKASLMTYLVNFSRSFIYTTALPPYAVASILSAYEYLKNETTLILSDNISFFKNEVKRLNLNFIPSNSAIHCCVVGGNQRTKHLAAQLFKEGYDVKAILSPTVSETQERLRFCLHTYNSYEEITHMLENLATFVDDENR